MGIGIPTYSPHGSSLKKDRAPDYQYQKGKAKKSISKSEVDNISDYVKENLKKAVKPRGQEHR